MAEYKITADRNAVTSERPIVDRDDAIALANVHLAENPKVKEITVSGTDGSVWKRTPSTGWKLEQKGEESVWPKVGVGVGLAAAGFAAWHFFLKKPEAAATEEGQADEPALLQRGTKLLGVFDSEGARDAFAEAAHAAGSAFLGIAVPVGASGVDLDAATPYVQSFAPDLILLGLTRQAANGATFFETAAAQGKVVNVYTRGTPPKSENENLLSLRNASKPFYGVVPQSSFTNLSGFAKETLTILGEDNPSQNERIL